MAHDADLDDRAAALTIARATARRAVRSGALWGLLFGLLVLDDARNYHTSFPTVASREEFAQTFGTNSALAAIAGPARRIDTIEGFVAWRMFGLMIIVGAIWGLLTATRLLRGEEDAGRWELLLAGRTTRRRATLQALAGLAAGFVALWSLTAALIVVAGSLSTVGFTVSACLFYATAATASAAMFLAIGAMASQLGRTRRQANGLAAAAFAVSFLIRMVADSVSDLAWLRWLSPLGWVENLRPLTGSQPFALVPVTILAAAAAWAAVHLADGRDVGAGVLGRRETPKASMQWLGGGAILVARLERWVALAWIGGLAMLGLLFGVVAQAAAEAHLGDKTIEDAVSRLGGNRGGAAAWIGYEFLYIAALIAFAAAGQIAAMRDEEAEGHLDNLLACAVSRRRWLVGRLGFAVAMVAAAGLASGIGGLIGVATRGSDIGLMSMLEAGVNVATPALVVLGVGTLLYGVAPRVAVPLLYGLVLWSFVIQIIGSTITTNHWLLDTAVLSHLGPVPATSLDWAAVVGLTVVGVIAALGGLRAFERRDLAAA